MKILGLDLATYKSGWALIEAGGPTLALSGYGLIDLPTAKKVKLCQRLDLLAKEYAELLEKLKPDYIIMEDAYIRFIKSAMSILRAQGVVQMLSYRYNQKEVTLVKPSKVRSLLGCKDKKTVRIAANKRYGLELTKDEEDISDAIAVAWAGYSLIKKK